MSEYGYNESYIKFFYKKIFGLYLTPDEFSILVVLHTHDFNPESPKEVFPSVDKIIKKIKISKEMCRFALSCLNEATIIYIKEHKRSRGKPGNSYQLRNWEKIDETQIKEMAERLIKIREIMRLKLREERKERKARRIGRTSAYNTDTRIGFNIDRRNDDNTDTRPGSNIINPIINQIPLIEKNNIPKFFKIIDKKKIYGKTYAFKDNRLIYCYEDKTDYEIANLRKVLPNNHELLLKINELYTDT